MKWYWKCVIDSGKALFPFQRQLRQIKYTLKPYPGDVANEKLTIGQGLLEVDWVRKVRSWDGLAVMEVGTGWQPLIPIVFSLAGAGRVYLADQNRLLTTSSFASTIEAIRREKHWIAERLGIEVSRIDQALAWKPEDGLEAGLKSLRLEYMAPCDCRAMPLPAQSLDVVTSRAVLEHVPPQVIQDIFHESRRLLRPSGLNCHIVDNSDHWEFRDKALLRINFLRFTESVFRWTTIHSLNYQNRLRHSQYLDMLQKAGFKVIREDRDIDQPSLQALPTFPLAAPFRDFTPEDIATITTYVLAEKS